MKKTIGVIGGGACGILILNQLVEKLSYVSGSYEKITIIEKGQDFGPGMVYKTPLDSHIINMRANTMGANIDDATHFSRWLASFPGNSPSADGKPLYAGNDYPPRKVYGEYLKDIFHSTLKKADAIGIKIELIRDEAIGLPHSHKARHIRLANGSSLQSDCTVLALGNFPNPIMSDMHNIEGFFRYPWPVEVIMEHVPGNEPVCVIGSGLSAVDTLLTLLAAGQKEKVYFVSRNGLLPKVQGVPQKYDLQFLSMDQIKSFRSQKGQAQISLDQMIDLFFNEIEAAEGKSIDRLKLLNPAGSTLENLEKDIHWANNASIPYQNALIATEDIIGELWSLLSAEDQCRFDCEYKTLWTIYRHPMPLINAKIIRDLLRSGQLEILSGINSIHHTPATHTFSIDLRNRHGECQTLDVPFMINATGQCLDVCQFNSKLMENLLSAGIAVSHPRGGISVDYDTGRVIHQNGRVSNSLYAIGELTRGVHFYTNGIGPCVRRARDIVEAIVDQH